MGFSRGSTNTSSFKEETVLVDNNNNQSAEATKFLGTPFMASSIKGLNNNNQTSDSDSNSNTHTNPPVSLLFQPHHHHHQIQGHHHHQIPYSMINQSSSSSSHLGNFISKDNSTTGAYDLGELDQALFLYLDGQDQHPSNVQDHQRQNSTGSTGMRPPTLNIFPSQPMHVEPTSTKGSSAVSGTNSKRPSDPSMELANSTRNDNNTTAAPSGPEPAAAASKAIKREGSRKGPTSSSEQEGPKTPDPKTLRRLAQNREAARKSRLRKKAYVQQLESSRIKLTQLEQELQRARSQGMFLGGGGLVGGEQVLPIGINHISQDAAVFDMEYARWMEEHHRLMCELRAAVQEHLPENELRIFVDNCLAHYDQMISLKGMVAKSDVFHLVSGMWKTPAERCFMWMGGFRPSELIKIILSQIEPLTEQQILGICGLQQSTQEAEEALSQGLEALNQSLSDTITSDSLSCPPNMSNYMGQMAIAMNKLSTLEGFVRQADNLRHQTFHRLHQILTTRQAARCLLAIAEYFHRLRALSSLWLTRSRPE
ncbi:Basic-leucine zipper transcription factor [Parasponia andersonii]|uniref:Basic-leucine zipper transcription factor n=1 Tax=Parasponia andersonii TaxID=3476 RepID=A0A2P5BTZ0_PARAD|nr:Basic-leucine zipper transcription factor [Parasponia andersonii]